MLRDRVAHVRRKKRDRYHGATVTTNCDKIEHIFVYSMVGFRTKPNTEAITV